MKQINEVAEENAAVQNNMKTNDDDYNMVSSTTKDDSSLMKLMFSVSEETIHIMVVFKFLEESFTDKRV